MNLVNVINDIAYEYTWNECKRQAHPHTSQYNAIYSQCWKHVQLKMVERAKQLLTNSFQSVM